MFGLPLSDIVDYLLSVVGVIVSLFGGDGTGFIADFKDFLGGLFTDDEAAE